jgi:geranylgeranyl diphosphate synthase type II
MNFKEYIESHKVEIYSEIMKYLPVKPPYEHYMIAREYSERQGSYRRPGLLMLCGEMFGAKKSELLLPSAAMQISEDWILIHDDVEDDSEMRRGKPALHKLYGKEIAINAGDAVHLAMWKIVKDYMEKAGAKSGGRFFDYFYNMLQYTVEGQFVETNFIYNTRDLSKATEELYYRIIGSKTCFYSVYGPMQLGAIVAGQDAETLKILQDIGSPAGIAFQITDDILDMMADEKVFGKQKYGDLYEGKLTLIILHAYRHADQHERTKINRIYRKGRAEKNKKEIEFLVNVIEKYGGIDYAKKEAERYGHMAKQAVLRYGSVLPNNRYKDILMSAIEELYMRKK